MLAQVGHGTAGLALTGEDDVVGLPELAGVVGHHGLNAQPMQGIDDRADISCIIFDDGYAHFFS